MRLFKSNNLAETIRAPEISRERRKVLIKFQKNANIQFKKLEWLNLAFCHRSFKNEYRDNIDNNERLEFLGDSVLGVVTAHYLFDLMKDSAEGDLARIKSIVVSEDILAEIALNIEIDKYLLIGKGEECSGGRQKSALLADCMEAIIGAYYLDSGFQPVTKFILEQLTPQIQQVRDNKYIKDFKTLLQEFVQKKFKLYPKYLMVKKSGPDHNRTFWMEVDVNGIKYGPGKGHNKKKAEQEAARLAYLSLAED